MNLSGKNSVPEAPPSLNWVMHALTGTTHKYGMSGMSATIGVTIMHCAGSLCTTSSRMMTFPLTSTSFLNNN